MARLAGVFGAVSGADTDTMLGRRRRQAVLLGLGRLAPYRAAPAHATMTSTIASHCRTSRPR